MKNKKIIVIGAGLSGLSSAALLAQKGYSVTILEKQNLPGGVAGCYMDGGFTFDMGPTWYLMPEVFENYFAHFNKKVSDFYELVDLNPSYKIFFKSDDSVTITRDIEKNFEIFEKMEKGSSKKLKEYLEDAKYKYDTAMKEFLYREYNSILDFFNRKMIFEGLRLNIFNKLDNYAKKFFKNPKIRKILEYNIVFLGCSPYKSPALYSLMAHVDLTQGVRYPAGGITKLVNGLYQLARDNGVEFNFGSPVKKINVINNKVKSVQTSNSEFDADIVLSTADYQHTEMDLLDSKYQSYSKKYWNKKVLAPSVLLMYLGINKKIPSLEHHNLFLSTEWEKHFTEIFDKPSWPDNPSYYIGCPSQTDPSVAPEGCENLFILIPVSPGLNDSDDIREKYYDKIINHLEKLTGTTIRDSIISKKIISHRDFINNNLFKGTALGLAHTLFQTAYFRPSHKSKKINNLYFSSHYTHPGIGMPMVMISSEIIAEKIAKEDKQ